MTVKELSEFFFFYQDVKLVCNHLTVFTCKANELEHCRFKNREVKPNSICITPGNMITVQISDQLTLNEIIFNK